MTNAPSYVHGASDVAAARRDHRRPLRPRRRALGRPARALVVREQGVRWTWAELRGAGRRLRRRPPGARPRARRPRRHLVAQQCRVGGHPVRHRQGRPDPGQHQPGLPHPRARVRAEQGRLPRAGHRHQLQDQRLSRHAARAGLGAGHTPAATRDRDPDRRPRARHDPASPRSQPLGTGADPRAPRRARRHAPVRRSDQHPVHQRHHGRAQGRHAHPPQHPQQRLLRRRGANARRPRTGSASRSRSTTASAWCWATSPASPTARAMVYPGGGFDPLAVAADRAGGALHGPLRRADHVHRRARPPRVRRVRPLLPAHRHHGGLALPDRGHAPGRRARCT